MMTSSLLGYTHLAVGDLERSLAFYRDALGLQIRSQESHSAALGSRDTTLLVVTEIPQAVDPGPTTGLYHFALRLPSRLELARFVKHLIDRQIPVQGVADHGVSEAIYLTDPDGNGIEVYRDRPRAEWYSPTGDLVLTTDPLDLESLLSELPGDANGWHRMPIGTILGHIHLHVSDLETSAHFYQDILGMDLVAEYGESALFFSWNGYHHHLGVNTWMGPGASQPPENSLGLIFFTLELISEEVEEIQKRIDAADYRITHDHDGLFIRDPSGNGLVIRTSPTSSSA